MGGSAAIIGGGIGGLAAARALRGAGWQVRVFEKAPDVDAAGTALGMWPAAVAALDEIGIGAAVRRTGAPQEGGSFLRPDGSRIASVAATRRGAADPVYLLSRPALLRLLVDGLPAGALRLDTDVDDVRALQADHDLVVVADGVFSRTRSALFGDTTRATYAGATAWRGTVAGATTTVTETWGPGQRFGITPREDGRTNWYASAVLPERSAAPAGELAELRDRFGGWHPGVRRILDVLREPDILRHDLYDLRPPLRTYISGNAVLIGDAAHAMTPDLGRGACEALIDAVTLARCVAGAPRIADGLATYDRMRRPPTQRLARVSRLVGHMAHARRFRAARDLAARAAVAVGPPA
ncbi:MAG TPA: FAD-dependent monooxygenase [Micromonosporaceae bacterium]|nr:FAD-dependent monooxygenase [Micromonosporaceae bacterium]